ncbi:putative Zn-binding protein involved in type VI secretion [Pseudomonas sp. BIGb0278]|uniref:PAAR domain-containing protein n=1 Tax=Pseudomonas sp. BIGb0278 TaxID=2940607 RepID=UPI0021686D2D|nr:PAAR domain-containing protein [Pseudomonas sp. BIGb0278]MCS4282506.1 putative Zn-binding protein involved in type VI secretion [Pseudomonas sp. BIGb0278]
MRVIIDGKGQAVDGDDTTTGAVCIATGDGYICDGRMVLRVGDKTTACPLCAEPGTVAEGAPCFISDGSEVAVDGSLVQCACPPGTNRVVAPPDFVPPWRETRSSRVVGPSAQSFGQPVHFVDSRPYINEPGFHIVQRNMSFPQVLMQLAGQDSTLPISRLQMLNPTFQQGFKAGEIFVIGDPDNGDACTREEAQLMAAAQQARDSLALLDYDEAEFMMEHQAEIAGLLTGASQSMGVGKDVLEQGLRQVRATLLEVDQLHKQQFAKFGHLYSPEFFASRQKLLRQLDRQLKAAFLNKRLNLGPYERLRRDLKISTKSLVHHWSKAGGAGQIPGYATHLDEVAKVAKYVKYGGHIGTALGGTSSYLKVEEVCRAGETEECKRIRFTEAGSFIGGLSGGSLGAAGGKGAAVAVCGFAGPYAPVCSLVMVGAGAVIGGKYGGSLGEVGGEVIYEKTTQ